MHIVNIFNVINVVGDTCIFQFLDIKSNYITFIFVYSNYILIIRDKNYNYFSQYIFPRSCVDSGK